MTVTHPNDTREIAVSDAPSSAPCISLRGITKRYRDHTALAPLDLDIHEGEFFCLLGPSGCGKTTTLNIIGGFVAPSGGSIHIRGTNVAKVPAHRRDVNTVFQSYALFPHMSVADNIGFGLRMARTAKADLKSRVSEALRLVGLDDKADRMPGELSGGQQQRVAVARALVNRPAVLLLDEPLSALDLKLRKRLQSELSQIHKNVGTTFVLVTHDQDEAMSMADRIAVMRDGRVEQVGTPEEIYLRPTSAFVASFLGESNFIDVVRQPSGAVVTTTGFPVPTRDQGSAQWSTATLAVRPEALRLTAEEDTGLQRLSGTVRETSFRGSTTRITVDVDGTGSAVVSSITGRDSSAAFVAGDRVQLGWDAADGCLLDHQR
ncbi:hypothetical protein B1R94_27030 [Mycolicibacterium litorale]|nr:hypothetical protein B1R94_27030 [Mycolicibacterium litorale]